MRIERAQMLGALASLAMLASLAIALTPGRPAGVVIALAGVSVVAFAGRALPETVRLIGRRRILIWVVVLAGLLIAWFVTVVVRADHPWQTFYDGYPFNAPRPGGDLAYPIFGHDLNTGGSWPWRIGRLPLLWLVLAILCAIGGFVLNADAVRVHMGYTKPRGTGWRLLTSVPTRGGRIAVRAVPGVALVVLAAILGINLVSSYVPYYDASKAELEVAVISLISLFLILGPAAVGLGLRADFDKEGRAREEERQRFAAHLHDSVLQTLALIQRQAADPDAVAKLARRQEHALRAWMAGETDLTSATLAGALREMLAEVEDEQGVKAEMTVIGDTKLDSHGEELIAAAREALRNVARHAPGAPVNVFLNINGHGVELFVRDGGPGFDFDAVPPERRGLRDAVIGRMQLAGGSAVVESLPGEGTEVILRLPPNRSR